MGKQELTYTQARKIYIQRLPNDHGDGTAIANLTRNYIGFAEANAAVSRINAKQRLALRGLFIKFASLLEHAPEITTQQINGFVENLYQQALVYERQIKDLPEASDAETLNTTRRELAAIVAPFCDGKNTEQTSIANDLLTKIGAPTLVSFKREDSGKSYGLIGMAIFITIAGGVLLGLSLGTDIIPDIQSLWEDGSSPCPDSAATAAPTGSMLIDELYGSKALEQITAAISATPVLGV